jgi:maltooligosyltrehalose trehalohydrolase
MSLPHGDFGARLISPHSTQFRLWAPDVSAVAVRIGQEDHPMVRDAEGVFTAILPVGPGTHYRYLVGPDNAVPDPASRAQAGDTNDDSIVFDPAFSWQHQDWQGRPWEEAIIYELHIGAFGGYAGVAQQLPRLVKLGITAIELMPVAEFPGRRSWGYDGVLHYAPDAAYGTPDELKQLVDEAHGLGLMVYLDVVYNHFGPSGNYLNEYAKSFFRKDIQTPWGDAIDFRRSQVRRFYIENALYWLQDFKFDGLRFDAVGKIEDPTFLLELATEIRAATPGRHVHLILENEHNHAHVLRAKPDEPKHDGQWTDDWHHCLHVLLTGETEGYYEDYEPAAQLLARCMAEGFAYQGEPSKHLGGTPRGEASAHLPATAFIICLQNHDQIGNRALGERLSVLTPPAALRAATLLLLLTPQIPMIFMGDEWGETKPFLFFTDHEDELAGLVREGRKKEFGHFAAFKNPDMQAKIPDPNAIGTFTASIPEIPITPTPDQAAMMALFEEALKIRREKIIPRMAGTVSAGAQALGTTGVRAAWTLNDGAVLTLAANFGDSSLPCEPGPGEVMAGDFGKNELLPFTCCAWLQPA